MDMIKIGKYISERRRVLGYTQEELGARLGVTDKAVSKWERGISCPDVSLINSLAVVLKTRVSDLLDGESNDASSSSISIQKNEMAAETDAVVAPRDIDVVYDVSGGLGHVSPYLFGNNLEHTRSGMCAGLSAQMLKNRKFVGKPSAMSGVAYDWYIIGEKTYCSFAAPYTRHYEEHYHMKRDHECNSQQVCNFVRDEISGIGQHELVISKGMEYAFAIVAKSEEPMVLTVSLTDRKNATVYAQQNITVESDTWTRYTAGLTSDDSDADADLRITFDKKGRVTVGAVSLMPADNFCGMRKDVIKCMKDIGIKVLRWPGGNFAGEYNWFDGLLPVDERAPFESYLGLETQPHTLGYDFHEINTDDFIALCREIGAEPYLTINPAWNTPEESAMWVEYCNGDASTEFGGMRVARGHAEPYNVMLWSLGNEFGYGHMEGDNTASGYSQLVMQHGERMLEVCDTLSFCSSGPYPNDLWAKYSAKPLAKIASLVSLHCYMKYPKYTSADLIKSEYYECISSVNKARSKLHELRNQLDDQVKISFDEWNTWYAWYRPSCVIDGMFTALMLHLLICEAQKSGIEIACHFEAVNESAIRVTATDAYLTAMGQAFSVMKTHINGILRYANQHAVVTERHGLITATVINSSFDQPMKVQLPMASEVTCAKLYVGNEVFPNSLFDEETIEAKRDGDKLTLELPARSIAFVQMKA